ncbi:MAG: hypothetical protein PF448_01035 [Bacteroidales bacterium]|jgi:hypothetical protein|nr:hypothetical protein [Bacteroidales bacterium]
MKILISITLPIFLISCLHESNIRLAGHYQCRGFYNSGHSITLHCDSSFEYKPYINTAIVGTWKKKGQYIILTSEKNQNRLNYAISDTNKVEKLSTDFKYTRIFTNEKWVIRKKKIIDPNHIKSEYTSRNRFKQTKQLKCN